MVEEAVGEPAVFPRGTGYALEEPSWGKHPWWRVSLASGTRVSESSNSSEVVEEVGTAPTGGLTSQGCGAGACIQKILESQEVDRNILIKLMSSCLKMQDRIASLVCMANQHGPKHSE